MSVWLSPATNGFFLISEEDRHLLKHDWSIVDVGCKKYVRAQINGTNTYLHRAIMSASKGQEVDHINGDGLDNSRGNLRVATRSQNCANRRSYNPKSGFRGVYPQSFGVTWRARIMVNKKFINGGNFSTPEEAARRYDELALENFGEFAVLNFPKENYNV